MRHGAAAASGGQQQSAGRAKQTPGGRLGDDGELQAVGAKEKAAAQAGAEVGVAKSPTTKPLLELKVHEGVGVGSVMSKPLK